jgi:hypothetical protein
LIKMPLLGKFKCSLQDKNVKQVKFIVIVR